MPIYEYRCGACAEVTSRIAALAEAAPVTTCDQCGAEASRIISRPSVHRSNASKLDRLDPKYDKMVDKAMASTPQAEPDRLLRRMKPFPGES